MVPRLMRCDAAPCTMTAWVVTALVCICASSADAQARQAAAPVAADSGPVPVVFAPGIISGPANDLSPAFTPDGNTVFFTRANGSQSTIVVSRRSHGQWSKPTIASFSGEWRDLEAAMAPDGSYLVFISNRPAAPGGKPLDGFYNGQAQVAAGGNVWRVDRTATGWGAPQRLPDAVNSNTSIYSPSVVADGSIYFMQPTGSGTRFHLFRAQHTGGTYAQPIAVPIATDTTSGDFDPAVARDESFMVFSSSRLHDKGTSLFIVFRENGAWGAPTYMGDVVSEPGGNNIEARLSPDNQTLYFSSRRVTHVSMPLDRAAAARGLAQMEVWDNGLQNVWSVPLDRWVSHRG